MDVEQVDLCKETINIVEGRGDQCSWLELWRAAAAVEKLCVQNGRAGVAFKQGAYNAFYLNRHYLRFLTFGLSARPRWTPELALGCHLTNSHEVS